MKRHFAQLIMALLLAGCATQAPDVSTYYDPATGSRTDLLSDHELKTSGPPRELVELDASRLWKDYYESTYYLEVRYMARDEVGYLEIPAGETLTVIADGKPVKFSGVGSANMRKPYKKGIVHENALYPATKSA